MKKIIKILLSIILVFSLTGCFGNKQNGGENTNPTNNPTGPQATPGTTEKEWGVLDAFSTSENGILAGFYINFPSLTGIPEGTGLVAYQEDDTRVVLAQCQNLEISSVDSTFPACFTQTVGIFKVNYGMRYSDGEFTIESKESAGTINGYEMYKFVGTHSFKYQGNLISYKYVAYATKLKTNGAYIYWLVQDESQDQSLYSTIEEYAYKMALSLREE